MEGKLWIWTEGKFWHLKYCVSSDEMLHQYSSKGEADSKSGTAMKKNRLPLSSVKVAKLDSHQENKYAFNVSVLDGRIEWQMAAASDDLREKWIKALTF